MASCRSARVCLQQSSPTTKRLFSSSASRRRNGALATFPPTSSPELDKILDTMRNNVFFPNHLSKPFQQLVYRPSLQHHLTGDDPVSASLSTTAPSPPSSKSKAPQNVPAPPKPLGNFGSPQMSGTKQTLTLQPLSRFEDEPRSRPAYNRVLDLLQTTDDFAVLPDLIREMRLAGRTLPPQLVAKTVRKASQKGQIGLAIELFRRTETTGLKINQEEAAREAMRGALEKAIVGDWEQGVLDKALKHASVCWRLIADPKQLDTRTHDKAFDARKMPEVAGAGLALAAVRAMKYGDGKDEDGEVAEWVDRFLKTEGRNEIELDNTNWWDCNEKLMRWAPVNVGGQLASKVLGNTPATQELGKTVKLSEKALQVAKPVVEGTVGEQRHRRGLAIFDSLTAQLE